MPRDLPDWGAQSAQATVHEVTDVGELAARLGSIVTHDRRGDVIFMDSFEDGLNKWTSAIDGTDASVDLSVSRARNGMFSARLIGGKTADYYAKLFQIRPRPTLSILGVECHFSIQSVLDTLDVKLSIYDGDYLSEWELRYDDVNDRFQYLDDEDEYQDIATSVHLFPSASVFHALKLVGDTVSGEYERVILNERCYSLIDIAARVTESNQPPQQIVTINLTSRSGQNNRVYIDDVIFTQNEPEQV